MYPEDSLMVTGPAVAGWLAGRARAGYRLYAAALAAAALATAPAAVAADSPDSLDPTFGGDGIVTTPFGGSGVSDLGLAMARQPDGKLVVAGVTGMPGAFGSGGDFAVARYNTDGSLDTTFDGDGKVTTSFVTDAAKADEAWGVAIAPDGKIVAAGVAGEEIGADRDFAVARYNADGSLDTTFDGDGKARIDFGGIDQANAVTVQTDGKVVAAGGSGTAFAVGRLNSDGTPDTTFDTDGKVTTVVLAGGGNDTANAVLVQPDDKIVAAGSADPDADGRSDFAVVRYNTNGTLDSTFSGDGMATAGPTTGQDDEARGLVRQTDGKLVVAGHGAFVLFALARFNTDGSLDTSFDGDGKVLTSIGIGGQAYAVALAPDQKIVAAGTQNPCGFDCDFAAIRYDTDGSVDETFDADGMVTNDVAPSGQVDFARAVTVQPDGKIAAAGYAEMGPPEYEDYDFAALRYLENGDTTPPGMPTVTDTDPDSPGSVHDPEVKGTADAGTTVRIYTTSDCTGTVEATGSAAAYSSTGLTVEVGFNTTTTLYAKATDPAGNTSACSSTSVTYVMDATAPTFVSFTGTTPASPGDDNSPEVKGTAEAGSTVRLYTTSNCTGTVAAQGSAADFASPGLTVSVADNSSTTFKATATDAAGNTSTCSPAALTYVEDSTTPDAPSITDTDPNSPANDNNPEVKGTAEAGSSVNLYTASDCSGSSIGSGTAAAFASPGLTITVANDSTNNLYATATDAAGHVSACSSAFTYVEDSTAPAAPAVTDTDPDSPANENNPEVKGTVGGGSPVEVRIFKIGVCSGTPAATGTPAEFTGTGITVNVSDNTSSSLVAQTRDAAGNLSGCSSSLQYVEDSNAPAAPVVNDSDPNTPANDNGPEIKGSAEAGATVKLYTSSDCTGSPVGTGSAAAFASPGFTVAVADDSSTSYRATATDAAGNTSPCSSAFTYVEDSTAPDAPAITDTDPDSPSNDNNPEVKGSVGGGSPTQVRLYKNSDCSGAPATSGTVAAFTGAGVTVNVTSNVTTALSARTADAAGNESGCSNTIDYVEDSVAPSTPSVTDTDPNSPANDNNPEVKGSADAGTTVNVYTTSFCSGLPVATGSAADYASPGLTVAVADNSTTVLRATATDAAGNTSSCTLGGFTYIEDSIAPDAPSITDTDPDSPANDNNPEVKGTVGGGSPSGVRVYTNDDCSGSPASTGSISTFTGTGITVAVPSDVTTALSARTVDAAGNESPCSNTISYTEDSTPPGTPSITDSDPDSPANENAPEIKGTADVGSTVLLYKSSTCSGATTALGTATGFASPGLTVSVSNDSTTTLTARASDAAGNLSPCSGTFTYVEDSTGPSAPSLTDTDPDSPANDNNPEVKGTAEAGSTVNLYTSSDCSGSPAATGGAASYSSPGLTVTVADGSSTTFKATATDAAGNVSACSSGSLTYVEDSTTPDPPELTDTDPDSPANDNNPEVKGTAEAGTTVRVYATSDCSGTPASTGTAVAFASPGITTSVANNSSTTFRATATDAAGNTSACSSTSIDYVEDSTPPDPPELTDTDPDSPANDTQPEVKGTAEAGSTVRLYTSSVCLSSVAAEGGAAAFASPGLTVTVADDSTTTYYAKATDAAGNTSSCSTSSITYVEDSTAPSAPSVTDTDPDSPANDNAPEVKGTAAAGSTVRLYTTSDCTGPVAATGAASSYSSPGLTVSVADDSSTTFRATATDAAGNASGCSATSVTYMEDSTGPDAPSITDTDPDSPANDNSPEVKGTVGAGSPTQVELYKNGDCSGTPAATGTVASFTGAGITVNVTGDATTTLTARTTDQAGNDSPCSGTFSYTEDSAAPAAPSLTDTDPDSPANDNSPEVKGAAEAGSTVTLYTNSSCTSTVAASGSAAAFATPGLTTTVADNTTTTYHARATDAAGNVSGCSTSSIAYTEDSTAPSAPSLTDTDPDSPANDNSPAVKGTAAAGSTVKLYTSSDCSGSPVATGSAASYSSPGLTATVADDSSTTFRATATDAAGNVSGCSSGSLTYTEDSTAPSAPSLTDTDPDSPANDNSPVVKGTAEVGSTVSVYATADCTGPAAATGSSASFTSPGLTATVADDSSTAFRATATDAAGNTSSCSSSTITYVEDSTAPDAPSITDTDPDSPANDNSPEVKGTVGAGSPTQVELYKNGDCSGTPAATGTVAAFTGTGITVSVTGDVTTMLTARATDQSGNNSTCSASFSYTEDSTAPAAPSLTDTDPDSPANDNSPEIKGTAAAGSTVKLYTNSTCTGSLAAEGSAASFASPGLTVAVANDTTTTYRATATDAAGNVSDCSTSSIAYTEDSTAPAAPSLTDTDPDSPANDNNPEVEGTAAAGSTVSVYTTSDCTGTPVATGSAAAFSSPGLTVAVANDSTTTFRATATDSAGNASGCSTSSIAYTEDSTAPAAPSITDSDPDSPSNVNDPEIKGTAAAGTTVSLFSSSGCSGPADTTGGAATFASPGLTVTVSDDSTTTFSARATDAAGNASACSDAFTYAEDSTAPTAQVDSGPSGTTSDSTPTFTFSVPGGGASFECRVDGGPFAACGSPHTLAALGDGAHTFEVRATDAAGNVGPVSAAWDFAVDTDSDNDGVPDSSDQCPTVPAQTPTGCPAQPPPPDGDGDGVPDSSDQCPTVPAQTPTGCPAPPLDSDGDGVPDATDPEPNNPNVPGPFGATNGDDVLNGDALANLICGLLGNDVINGVAGDDTLFGDACNDKAKRIFDAQVGTDGNDRLFGNDGNDKLYGAGGKDALKGGTGNDRLYGGDGNDSLYGETGKDTLSGGNGNDKLSGGSSSDVLSGGAGDDSLSGSTGTNRYSAGSGNDTVSARNRRRETIDCGSGRRDRATVDRIDRVKGCEKVSRR